MTWERIQASFGAQSMMTTLGAKIVHLDDGVCHIAAPILPGSLQQQGFGHAALTFALGDSAAGYAALTKIPATQEVMTAEIKINLIAPAAGDRLIAKGRVEKLGRRLIVVTADVFAEQGEAHKKIALLQGTMIPVDL